MYFIAEVGCRNKNTIFPENINLVEIFTLQNWLIFAAYIFRTAVVLN